MLTSSVVKIIANVINIDWLRPYRIDNDGEAIGTGFFIDDNGYIATCAHVVNDAIKLWITIPSIGKDRIDVEIVGICDDMDLALLKTVNYKPKHYLKLGNSNNVKSGETVIASGYPLGQDKLKTTSGIISGYQDGIFQTDTPINPGNSGGPLIDSNEYVIGINSSKMMFADNVGYSIPIYHFQILELEMRKNTGKMIYAPKLFANFNNTGPDLIEYYGNQTTCKNGYFINKIHKKSPLYKAGLMDGDIICKFGKENEMYDVDNFGECIVPWYNEKIHIKDIMKRFHINDIIYITYWRNNEPNLKVAKIHLNTMEIPDIRLFYKNYDKIDYIIFGGMVVMQLTGNHLNQLFQMNISQKMLDYLSMYAHLKNRYEKILIITQIFAGSELSKLDSISSGDVIKSINNYKVNTLDDFRKAVFKLKLKNNKNFLKIQTILNTIVIMNVEKILKEENFLSENFKYDIDELTVNINKKFNYNINLNFDNTNIDNTNFDNLIFYNENVNENVNDNILNKYRFTFDDIINNFTNQTNKNRCLTK